MDEKTKELILVDAYLKSCYISTHNETYPGFGPASKLQSERVTR
jgi:hypothetical protein